MKKAERRKMHQNLRTQFEQWRKLPTPELLAEVNKLYPGASVHGEDREFMLQILVMEYVDRMV